jgi:hypothetical protein
MKHEIAIAQLARELARARHAIALERFVPTVFPAALLILAWAAFGLFGGQDRLAPLIASLATIAVLAVLVWLGLRAARAWSAPTRQDARARLLHDAGLDPGALDALEDQPSRLDPMSLALWEHQQGRARDAAMRAVAAPAVWGVKKIDRFRLRYVAIAAVAAGLLFAGLSAPDRLTRAFIPDPGPLLGDGPMEIEAWVAPAAYTNAAPVSLSERIGQRVVTPPSVEVTVRVTGPVGAPKLKFDGRGGHRETEFKKAADGAYEAHMTLPSAGSLRVVRFQTKARWQIDPVADKPPTASFETAPKIEKDKLVFKWKAADDFGVREIVLRATPVDPPPGLIGAAPVDTPLEGPQTDPKEADGDVSIDLAAHPYAGMKVNLRVVALDALGQEGASTVAPIGLPEKIFLQPLARAAIEIRKAIMHERRAYAPAPKLAKSQTPPLLYGYDTLFGTHADVIQTDEFDPRIERAPRAIHRAGKMIDALTFAPGDGYFRDLAVFGGFKAARAVLNQAREVENTTEAAGILWETALRAEYGDSADARRALNEAQKQLAEALARNAPQDEIKRLTDAVRQAMQNYIQSLMAEAQRNGQQNKQQSQEDSQQQERTQLSQNDLEAMMKEIERLSAEGKTAEAQKLLEKLQQLLSNLEVQMAQGQQGQGQPMPGQGQNGQGNPDLNSSVEGLSETMGKQRSLRDQTQQQEGKNGQPGQGQGKNGDQSAEQLAQRQGQLRQALNQAQRDAQRGGSQQNGDLDRADEAMGKAEQALRRGDLGGARAEQDRALREMRAGADRLAQQSLRDKENPGQDNQQSQTGQNQRRDPLGRAVGAIDTDGRDVAVPDVINRERVRDILDELRRRAQDPNRSETERDYLQRLLDRFDAT